MISTFFIIIFVKCRLFYVILYNFLFFNKMIRLIMLFEQIVRSIFCQKLFWKNWKHLRCLCSLIRLLIRILYDSWFISINILSSRLVFVYFFAIFFILQLFSFDRLSFILHRLWRKTANTHIVHIINDFLGNNWIGVSDKSLFGPLQVRFKNGFQNQLLDRFTLATGFEADFHS